MKTFKINASLDTTWKVSVTVWNTEKQLRKARAMVGYEDNSTVAFCGQNGVEEAHKTGLLAEMHFCIPHLNMGIIAHESYHAADNLRRICKLDSDSSEQAEELVANALQMIVASTVAGCKEHGYKIR